ncbi:MAG: hypothetical protein LBI94_08735 [Treponema sp.]|nr:hypothetical protein [Treponema sp.]
MCNKIRLAIIFINIFTVSSCASIQAGLYLASIDDNNGETILKDEPNVRLILENIIDSFENYTTRVFSRTAVNFQMKQTKLLTHSYYLITSGNGVYHTLSFYGTAMAFYSEGAWAYDTDSDISSYRLYLEGDNKWDVRELFQENTIDTKETLKNIISRMDSGITYYYNDHVINKPRVDNCNTALSETVVLEKGTSSSSLAASVSTGSP